jgi:dihydropyrimidine dehydrogenase (NAD+) subunit PreT
MAPTPQTPGIVAGRLDAATIAANFSDLAPPLSPHEALVAADRCYFCHDAPCVTACPTSIDIPLFIREIGSGATEAAARTILGQNILGGMCARVCPTETLCEQACVREAAEGRPVEIGRLQRFATDALMARGGHPFHRASPTGRRVAVVGAGPAGLECALTLGRAGVPVVVFDARETLGGQLAVAAAAPNRSGWRSLLSFYAAGIATAEDTEVRLNTSVTDRDLADFDDVVLAIGSREVLPEVPGIAQASSASDVIGGAGPAIASGSNVVVADDGFGWWPCVSAVEVAVRAGAATITVLGPGPAFAGALPPEARVQLLARLAGTPVEVHTLSALVAVADGQAVVKNVLSNSTWTIAADSVIAVGERRSNDGSALVVSGASVWAIGDMVVPRRAAHAIAEGRAVAERLIAARTPTPA